MVAPTATRRFTVDEYHRMAEAGILSRDDRVELIQGKVVEMEPASSRHAACVDRLNALFGRLHDRAVVRVQSPVRLDDESEPEPDLALLRPNPDYYVDRHPGPDDLLLVVEVAESSLTYDRDVKIPLYAAAGLGEAWLVDLAEGRVVTFRDPAPDSYREARTLDRGDSLVPLAFPDFELDVDGVLG